jgi:hypothetical protein
MLSVRELVIVMPFFWGDSFIGVSNVIIYYELLILYNVAVDDKLSKSFINKE